VSWDRAARRFRSRCEVDLRIDCTAGCATAEVALLRRRCGVSQGRAPRQLGAMGLAESRAPGVGGRVAMGLEHVVCGGGVDAAADCGRLQQRIGEEPSLPAPITGEAVRAMGRQRPNAGSADGEVQGPEWWRLFGPRRNTRHGLCRRRRREELGSGWGWVVRGGGEGGIGRRMGSGWAGRRRMG